MITPVRDAEDKKAARFGLAIVPPATPSVPLRCSTQVCLQERGRSRGGADQRGGSGTEDEPAHRTHLLLPRRVGGRLAHLR
jgi:hypothetical protein